MHEGSVFANEGMQGGDSDGQDGGICGWHDRCMAGKNTNFWPAGQGYGDGPAVAVFLLCNGIPWDEVDDVWITINLSYLSKDDKHIKRQAALRANERGCQGIPRRAEKHGIIIDRA
ncbi:uncharacterized protein MCYG_01463 [Microsporum canis CBS 113480]|uniref:Uncharacterized protein n=1 Tax=Arthroderma otae (strain ATCC MYA-4605 / CBS 113480) TaxID=554155 RepID=C5FH14_ARTOC|nr:uncharacterized protein MCYG_01463 [Microsporum canis CBS 113480]EEQ28644.1 predicted protein [Microsporum canis CBS 113480]